MKDILFVQTSTSTASTFYYGCRQGNALPMAQPSRLCVNWSSPSTTFTDSANFTARRQSFAKRSAEPQRQAAYFSRAADAPQPHATLRHVFLSIPCRCRWLIRFTAGSRFAEVTKTEEKGFRRQPWPPTCWWMGFRTTTSKAIVVSNDSDLNGANPGQVRQVFAGTCDGSASFNPTAGEKKTSLDLNAYGDFYRRIRNRRAPGSLFSADT